jgi:hypothetical protein
VATATFATRSSFEVGAHRENEEPRGRVAVSRLAGRDCRIVSRHDDGVIHPRRIQSRRMRCGVGDGHGCNLPVELGLVDQHDLAQLAGLRKELVGLIDLAEWQRVANDHPQGAVRPEGH